MIGNKIKELRTNQNLTQEDLAQKLFISRQTISRWENGQTTPTTDNLIELSTFFAVDINHFKNTPLTENVILESERTETVITETNTKKERLAWKENKYIVMGIFLLMAIAPFIHVWALPLSVYAFMYSKKKEVQHYQLIRLIALTSMLYFVTHLLIFLVGLFNLTESTTVITVD